MDPELLRTFDRLGIPLAEQKRLSNVAVDAVFDSVSIATTFKKELREHGIIFCSISEAVRDFPELVRKHLGSVVCPSDPNPNPQCIMLLISEAVRDFPELVRKHLGSVVRPPKTLTLTLDASCCSISEAVRDFPGARAQAPGQRGAPVLLFTSVFVPDALWPVWFACLALCSRQVAPMLNSFCMAVLGSALSAGFVGIWPLISCCTQPEPCSGVLEILKHVAAAWQRQKFHAESLA